MRILNMWVVEEAIILGQLAVDEIEQQNHGTAFDIVGKGIARTSTFEGALKLTVKMASFS